MDDIIKSGFVVGKDDANNVLAPLPALLANPSLLQGLEVAADILGTNYNTLAQQIYGWLQKAEDVCNVAYGTIQKKIFDNYGYAESFLTSTHAFIHAAINGLCNTIGSSIDVNLPMGCYTIQELSGKLKPGEQLQIMNCAPPIDSWIRTDFTYNDWINQTLPDFAINSLGQIVAGGFLDNSLTWHFPNGVSVGVNEQDAVKRLFDAISSIDATKYNPDKVIGEYVSCYKPSVPLRDVGAWGPIKDDCFDTIKPINPIIEPIVTNTQILTTPAIAAGISTSTPISGGGNTQCPPQTINVNIPAPIVNVTVQPCQPGTSGKVVTTKVDETPPLTTQSTVPVDNILIDQWEPPVDDLIEQWLNEQGYPEDYVKWAGNIIENNPSIMGHEVMNNTVDFSELGN